MARWISPRGRPPPAPAPATMISPSAIPNPNRAKYNTIQTTQESSSLSLLLVRLFPHIGSGMARGSSASMCDGRAWLEKCRKANFVRVTRTS
ncbi:hypothetical protein niasHT_003280 [Heterodera trifolii]|uniref:Uncharacterized protein n=1 Tax=Heterodera trifolii TaxID=157864 RepID=A0ABD2LQV7_9BILA